MNQKEAIAKAPESRKRRTPLGRKQLLNVVGKDPAFEYRFVNDDEGKIARFKEAGWELELKESVSVGDKRVENATPTGSAVEISVGQGKKAFLMKIPKEWYAEDQAEKQQQVDESEASTKRQALDGSDYGKVSITRN